MLETTNASPIARAILPLKSDAVRRAKEEAERLVGNIAKILENAGWDINVAAPRPDGGMPRPQYVAAQSKRTLFSSLTKNVEQFVTYRRSAPEPVKMDEAKIARFVVEAQQAAEVEYDAFVAKMVEKVGTCTSATLSGSHVWGYSLLTLTKADGSTETWKTQMIVNVSKLGKLFNQFPSRKVK
jgi:hypothetical protein